MKEELGKQIVQMLVTGDIFLSVVLLIRFLHKDVLRFIVLSLFILLVWYNQRNTECGEQRSGNRFTWFKRKKKKVTSGKTGILKRFIRSDILDLCGDNQLMLTVTEYISI